MANTQANFFQNALKHSGEECKVQEDYSGRGMYGKTTFGVVFDRETLLMECVLAYIVACRIPYEEIPELQKLHADNMGRSIIWY